MNEKIDKNFKRWLEALSTKWDLPIEQVALNLGNDEIANRVQNYPKVSAALASSSFDLQQFASAVRNCWIMGGRFDATRFNRFISNGIKATEAIRLLTENFPEDDTNASKRIEEFLESAVTLGFSTPYKTSDWAGAASLASLILTSIYPSRFVDFRRGRWKDYAGAFGYELPLSSASLSNWVIWAGKFAEIICATNTYEEFWSKNEPRLSKPLWVIAGICWTGLTPKKPLPEPPDPDSLSFPEGAEKRRWHLTRERNRALVEKAKSIALEQDPMLRCQVCGFSFTERYGEHGHKFIEAHHKQPIAELKQGSRTRLEDIALVCANCHRMLHYGDKTLSIQELKDLLHA